jgi:hypothetical protein
MGSLFAKPEKPKPPPPPAVMPDADDDQIEAAKRRRMAQQLARSGRMSTILSEGAGDFSAERLGG